MEAIQLNAEPRTLIGKQVKLLRHQDIIPGVIYGRHMDKPIAVQFDYRELLAVLRQAGSSAAVMVQVKGESEPYLVIFRDVQHHPIRRDVRHVDLQALSLEETVRVPVSITLVGDAPAVEEGDGVLMQLMTELEIEALPTALIGTIEIDLSGLTEIGNSITVGDITPPEGVTILSPHDETIVQITHMAEEEVEEEEVLELAMEEQEGPALVGREREEEEEEED